MLPVSNLVLLYEYYSSLLCLKVLYVFSENVVVAMYPRAPPHSIRMYNEGSSKIVKQTINGQNNYGHLYRCTGVEKEKKRLKHCKFYGKTICTITLT